MKKKPLTYVAGSQAIALGAKVRNVVPGLAEKSRKTSSAHICPQCGDHMGGDKGTKRCRTCFIGTRTALRTSSRRGYGPLPADIRTVGGRSWGGSREGRHRPQPPLTPMVRQPDGSWKPREKETK